MGPGAEEFHGFMENVEVFRVMVTALGLGAPPPKKVVPQAAAAKAKAAVAQ